MVTMLMVEGKVIFSDGGVGGVSYARPKLLIRAQDIHLRVCMEYVLTILQCENKKYFRKRWKQLVRAATLIHRQMQVEDTGSMPNVGALQAPDIIREELARAASTAANKRHTDRHVCVKIERLRNWATNRKRVEATQDHESSPTSVSSSEPAGQH